MTSEINYTEIGKKIRSKEGLSEKDRKDVMRIGIDFISEEIKSISSHIWLLDQKSKEFQEYLPYITLLRLVRNYNEVKKYERDAELKHNEAALEQLSEVQSVKLFKRLEKEVSEKLNMKDLKETDFSFEDMLIVTLSSSQPEFNEDEYINKIGRDDIRLISNIASEVIPKNPDLSESRGETKFILD